MSNHNIEKQYFIDVVLFFKEVQWLYNMPVTKILLEGALNLFPEDWLKTLRRLKNNELNNFVIKKDTQLNWPSSLIKFVGDCQKFNKLPNLMNFPLSIQLPQAFTKKLSVKKQHEIFYLAQIVHEQCLSKNISLIVDLGAGLGYISQLLNHLYGYQVLGLESNPKNVEAAKLRQKSFFPNSLTFVKYVCKDINAHSSNSIKSILKKEFGDIENICLLGLHACGDLSVHMTKLYLDIEIAQLLILLSCCYHKLTLVNTNRGTEENGEKDYFCYFPVSITLKNAIDSVNVDIGEFFRRPFMRLACQETSDRWSNILEEIHDQHSFHVLARAVLELYGVQNGFYLKKLVRKGTRKSQCQNFESYLKDCKNRYIYEKNIYNKEMTKCEIPWNEKIITEIITLWNKNLIKQKDVELYTALQLLLQNAAESLVLFDRLSFLKENNCEANIIPTMNRFLSPRCHAIISKKIEN